MSLCRHSFALLPCFTHCMTHPVKTPSHASRHLRAKPLSGCGSCGVRPLPGETTEQYNARQAGTCGKAHRNLPGERCLARNPRFGRRCGHGSKPMGSHFGIGAPPILVYCIGHFDVHWYEILTHGHVGEASRRSQRASPTKVWQRKHEQCPGPSELVAERLKYVAI